MESLIVHSLLFFSVYVLVGWCGGVNTGLGRGDEYIGSGWVEWGCIDGWEGKGAIEINIFSTEWE
jgi:hypothetical protein